MTTNLHLCWSLVEPRERTSRAKWEKIESSFDCTSSIILRNRPRDQATLWASNSLWWRSCRELICRKFVQNFEPWLKQDDDSLINPANQFLPTLALNCISVEHKDLLSNQPQNKTACTFQKATLIYSPNVRLGGFPLQSSIRAFSFVPMAKFSCEQGGGSDSRSWKQHQDL